jgi:hypothetical protein
MQPVRDSPEQAAALMLQSAISSGIHPLDSNE